MPEMVLLQLYVILVGLYTSGLEFWDHNEPRRPAMTPEDFYTYFYNLADQDRQVHLSRSDTYAIVYALERFPSPWLQDGHE